MIFLDLDGVLVDLVKGICEEFELDLPKEGAALSYDLRELEVPGLMDWLRGDGPGVDFWARLPAYPWTSELLELVQARGETWLLTKPTESASCWAGKVLWVQRVLGEAWVDRLIQCRHKELLAGPGRLLIDDLDSNVDEWVAAGGEGLVWPQMWNRARGVVERMNYAERNIKLWSRNK